MAEHPLQMVPRALVVFLATVAAALAAPASASAYEVVDVPDGGSVTGRVTFEGTVSAPAQLKVTVDVEFCGKTPIFDEKLVVSKSKGLANVIVFAGNIKKGAAPTVATASLENRACQYIPHVQAFAVGTELSVINSDDILHNTHMKLPKLDEFNYGLPIKDQVIKHKVSHTGLMKVGCDAGHTWMRAYMGVFDHPYFAVTDAEGKFEIKGLPPGEHKLMFWHESAGRQTKTVTVEPKGQSQLSVQFQ